MHSCVKLVMKQQNKWIEKNTGEKSFTLCLQPCVFVVAHVRCYFRGSYAFLKCCENKSINDITLKHWTILRNGTTDTVNVLLVFSRADFSNHEPARLQQQTISSDSSTNYRRVNYHIVWLLFLFHSPLWNRLTHNIRNLLIWLPSSAWAKGNHTLKHNIPPKKVITSTSGEEEGST